MTRQPMTEEQIERQVERKFNALDAALMAGRISQAEYDDAARAIDVWAEVCLAERERHGAQP